MVGVVILNWNGLEDTLRCLRSLEATKTPQTRSQITVIDNGSSVDPRDEIKRSFPHVDYVRLDKNIGYAAACNLGAKRALSNQADFILFLNNDAVLQPTTLEALIDSFASESRLGLVSPLIQTEDNPPRIEFAGGDFNYWLGKFKARESIPHDVDRLQRCDYASGCCLLISRKAIEQVGLFDERFFAYFEDTDLSIRAHKKDILVGCRTDTLITHKGSAATRWGLTQGTVSPLKHYLIARNRVILMRKHAPIPAFLFFLIIIQPAIALYYLFGFLTHGRMKKAHALLAGIFAGLFSPDVGPAIDKWH